MNVLVTGGTGFIGRHLICSLLGQNAKVRILTRSHEHFALLRQDSEITTAVIGDLADPATLRGLCAEIDTVFHLASYPGLEDLSPVYTPSDGHWRITVSGTSSLLVEAVQAGVKQFVFVSSVKAMGEDAPGCLDEGPPAHPDSAYGRAKLEAERHILAAGRDHGVHVCVLRLPLVYGPGNKGNISRLIQAIDRGYFPPFPEVGNRRSLVHVDDVVQALLLASELPQANGETYIVTDGQTYSTRMIYEAICRALGRPVPRWSAPVSLLKLGASIGEAVGKLCGCPMPLNRDVFNKLVGSACYRSDKIVRELGFRPRRTLYDALPEMIAEYRKS
ncbi:MAG: NAD-dependent epimerase/dehydratase family protein [Gammaproteobacteria bacterium]|nr:MAG: NAD-dependent epimerase/dehydratase family protein [Gammaproteobacteria bacterium]